MAKFTKTALKNIVKECLVEILSEGLGDAEALSESFAKKAKPRTKSKQKSIFDQMSETFERNPRGSDSVKFESRVSSIAKSATNNPVLQSILEDTAKTTLQDQLHHETSIPRSGHASVPAELAAPSSSSGAGLDISNLFGEATKNWGEVLERTSKKLP